MKGGAGNGSWIEDPLEEEEEALVMFWSFRLSRSPSISASPNSLSLCSSSGPRSSRPSRFGSRACFFGLRPEMSLFFVFNSFHNILASSTPLSSPPSRSIPLLIPLSSSSAELYVVLRRSCVHEGASTESSDSILSAPYDFHLAMSAEEGEEAL